MLISINTHIVHYVKADLFDFKSAFIYKEIVMAKKKHISSNSALGKRRYIHRLLRQKPKSYSNKPQCNKNVLIKPIHRG